jgi:hypothetical protein
MITTSDKLKSIQSETFTHCAKVMEAKNHDYCAGSADALANFRMATAIGLTPIQGVLLRVMDKIQRIRTFDNSCTLKVPESACDACDDIVNYAVLIKALLLEKTQQEAMQSKIENREIESTGGVFLDGLAKAIGKPKATSEVSTEGLGCEGLKDWAGTHHSNEKAIHARVLAVDTDVVTEAEIKEMIDRSQPVIIRYSGQRFRVLGNDAQDLIT